MLVACSSDRGDDDLAAYRSDIETWRAERLQRLKGPHGYLNLAGLFWLSAETTSLGSDAGNDIVLPATAEPRIGELRLTDSGVVLVTEPGVDVRYEDIPVRSILVADDTTENPVTITHGSFAWTIIKRDGRFALRLRDFENPAIDAFPPLEYFDIDPNYRVEARFERFDEPRVVHVDTVIEGLGWQPESPGALSFEIDGETFELETYDAGDELFLVFGDGTSGRETYPAGRFLYVDLPKEGTVTVIDFNMAYNPPCAFNDFATCPVAPPRNRIAKKIEAGEKFDPSVHFTPGSSH